MIQQRQRERQGEPGASLLHPFAVLGLVVLVANDHWLKHTHPGLLSGKLSGFAAVLLLPLFLHALFELGYRTLTLRRPSARTANRALGVCLAITGLVYAPPEVWPPAETAYRYGLGALQWPFRALWSVVHGQSASGLVPVRATADPSDLAALTMLWVAWRVARRAPPVPSREVGITASLGLFLLVSISGPRVASAAERSQQRTHDGFYASFELGGEGLFLSSAASVSNGFRQPISSSATGLAVPSGKLDLGGTIRGKGSLVVGGSLAWARVRDPIVSTLDTRFELRNANLNALRLGAFARYYPHPQAGLNIGLGAGLMSLELESSAGQLLRGGYLSLDAGSGFWAGEQWSLGVNARLTGATLRGEVAGATWLFLPGLFATVTWH